jgi:hypothetical protein
MARLLHASISYGTWEKYASGWKMLEHFQAHTKEELVWPLSNVTLRFFTTFCLSVRNLKPSSVRTYLSAIAYLHKMKGYTDFKIEDPLVEALLRASENLSMTSDTGNNKRRAMTLPLLKILGHNLLVSGRSIDEIQTIWTACTVCFFASTRMGELLAAEEFSFDPSATLLWSDILLREDDSVLIHIKVPKSRVKEGEFIDLFPFKESKCCPVEALKLLASRRKKSGRVISSLPVFTFQDGRNLTKKFLNTVLKVTLEDVCVEGRDVISCHSFRAGVPSAISRHPELMTEEEVMGWGRWSSSAYKKYTRLKFEQKKKIFNKIMSALL